MGKKYVVVFHLKFGNKDIEFVNYSTEVWDTMTSDFMELYNDYATTSNEEIDALNKEWHRLHPEIKRMDDDSPEMYEYGLFMKSAFEKTCEEVNSRHIGSPNPWMAYIEMDGPNPMFAARFMDIPDITMRFTLEPV